MRWTIQRSDESERVLAARVRDVVAGFVASGYVLAQDQTWTESNALALYDHALAAQPASQEVAD